MSFAATEAVTVQRRWLADQAVADVERRPSLESCYQALAPAVRGYFRSNGIEPADDLVGDTFVSVARGFRRFHGDADDLRRWVFTIARRRKVDHFRRLRVRRGMATGDPPEQAAKGDPAELDLDVDLLAALRELTAAQRDVVVLRFVADLSLDDVARIVRRSTGAVKSLQSRALAQLATRLGSG